MAYSNLVLTHSFNISSDHNALSAALDQFIFVRTGSGNADGEVGQAYANDRTLGVSQSTAKKGEGIDVGMIGISKLRLGGAVTRGQALRADAIGEGVRWLGAAAQHIGAIALESGADGEVIAVLLTSGQTVT